MSTILPVLIVGAGPTGLVTALFLAKSGVRCRIIDKDDSFHVGSRGFGVQPRTYELFQMLGILDDLKKHATPIPPFRAYKLPGGREVVKEWTLYPNREVWPDRPHGNGTCISQDKLEEVMRNHLQSYGITVELQTGLVALQQDDEKVVATLATFTDGIPSERREEVVCQYLVGADGAKGASRKLLGLTFVGETRDSDGQVWGDLQIDGLDNNWWHVWGNPGKWSIIVRPRTPGQGNQFHIGISGQSFDPVHLDTPEAAEKFVVQETGRDDLKFGKWTWISYFKPNMRIVDKFYDGRVFVIGDAAHVHSPSGGQGMNTGVYDAANIGWKLSLVVKGLALPSLLDSLDTERLPVITQMLAATSQLYTHMVSKLKPQELPPADSDDTSGWYRWRNDALEQYGVNYRYSDIVLEERDEVSLGRDSALAHAWTGYEGTKTLRAGDRAPDAPGLLLDGQETTLFDLLSPAKHTLLVFSTPGSVELSSYVLEALKQNTLQVFIVGTEAALSDPTARVLLDAKSHARVAYVVHPNTLNLVVIRPDGFIGCIVKTFAGVERYFCRFMA